MTLAPLLAAPPAIQIHAIAALLVALLWPFQFWWIRKGSGVHRATGYVWLTAMVIVVFSSFLIPSTLPVRIGPFGPIHLLSALALYSVVRAVQYARAHSREGHRRTLVGLSIGFWLAGLFTLDPGRIMGRMLFGP
ncbi:MAG TPA: DUF2306 domain-containing protein [Rhabdaerophilum sp.]|nr:DUF2306 domain-containing protein [Rhabdaerophilum sp.]